MNTKPTKQPKDMTDEELFDEFREQVTRARNHDGYNPELTRLVSYEMRRRGFWGGCHALQSLNLNSTTHHQQH